ncbi:hypothetical protein [Avrilella dinanensis]|nr:hypothetical protein [Avrilella dinanensis]
MKKILLLGLLTFGFIACNNDDSSPEGTTNVKTFQNVKVAFGDGF